MPTIEAQKKALNNLREELRSEEKDLRAWEKETNAAATEHLQWTKRLNILLGKGSIHCVSNFILQPPNYPSRPTISDCESEIARCEENTERLMGEVGVLHKKHRETAAAIKELEDRAGDD